MTTPTPDDAHRKAVEDAAAPHLLAPVEAEVQRLRESVTDHHNRELSALRTVERQMVEKAEAVTAERTRIAAAIRAAGHPDGYHRANTSREWAGIYCADCAVTERSARIAEGETSTIRDVDPGNAQDARRIAAAIRAECRDAKWGDGTACATCEAAARIAEGD